MSSLTDAKPPEDRTPGWKPDPLGSGREREWDGEKWLTTIRGEGKKSSFVDQLKSWPTWAKIVVPIVGVLLIVAVATSDEETGSDPKPAEVVKTEPAAEAPDAEPATEAPAAEPEEQPESVEKLSPLEKRLAAEEAFQKKVEDAANDTSGVENVKAFCVDLESCNVTYDIDLLGIFQDTELVQLQKDVWRTIFEEPKIKEGTILMSGPVTTVGGKEKTAPVLKVTCGRRAANQIDWDNVDKEGMETLCDWRELVDFG